MKATGAWGSEFGGGAAGGAMPDYGKNVVSPGLTGGAPGINYGGAPVAGYTYGYQPGFNPGFGTNFMTGAQGEQTQGLGGWLGSLWGRMSGNPPSSLPNY
jgi:hypothetical protein